MKRAALVFIAALAIGAAPTPAAAGVTLPPGSIAVPDTGTFLYLNSEAGDWVGGGREVLLVPAEGQRIGGALRFDHFNAFVCCTSQNWNVDISAPQGQPLGVGSYTGAARLSTPTLPQLDISGNGHGCNTMSGSFDVTEVSFSSLGEITVFDARFEQHCEGAAPALFGRVRIESPPPVPGGAFPPGNLTVPMSGTFMYSLRTNTPMGLYEQLATSADSRFDSYLVQGGNYFTVSVNQNNWTHTWNLYMAAPDGAPLVAGPYPNAAGPAQTGQAGLGIAQDGLSCSTVIGRFDVDELAFAPTGFYTVFQATFHLYCDSSPYMRHGRIRIELPPPTVLGVSVDGEGNITNRVGVPLISGTVSCSRTEYVQLRGTLTQVLTNHTTVRGEFGGTVFCNATSTSWTIQVHGDGPFNSSAADATADVSCFNCLTASATQVVKINAGNLK